MEVIEYDVKMKLKRKACYNTENVFIFFITLLAGLLSCYTICKLTEGDINRTEIMLNFFVDCRLSIYGVVER